MTIEFTIDGEKGSISAVAKGRIGIREMQEHYERLQAHPLYRRDMDQLMDALAATLTLTEDEARTQAHWFRANLPVRRSAVVVEEQAFGVARMIQLWVGNEVNVNVFRDMDSAREWLARPWQE